MVKAKNQYDKVLPQGFKNQKSEDSGEEEEEYNEHNEIPK